MHSTAHAVGGCPDQLQWGKANKWPKLVSAWIFWVNTLHRKVNCKAHALASLFYSLNLQKQVGRNICCSAVTAKLCAIWWEVQCSMFQKPPHIFLSNMCSPSSRMFTFFLVCLGASGDTESAHRLTNPGKTSRGCNEVWLLKLQTHQRTVRRQRVEDAQIWHCLLVSIFKGLQVKQCRMSAVSDCQMKVIRFQCGQRLKGGCFFIYFFYIKLFQWLQSKVLGMWMPDFLISQHFLYWFYTLLLVNLPLIKDKGQMGAKMV